MKNMKRKLLAALLTAAALVGMLGGMPARASYDWYVYMNGPNVPGGLGLLFGDVESANQIKNLKSSNPKVATVKKYHDANGEWGYSLTCKKPGRAVVSCKKKSETYKQVFVVKKYENPCQVFKIGSKNYASKLKSQSSGGAIKASGKSQKINIKAKKGWEIAYIGYHKSGTSMPVKIENGKEITFKKKESIFVTFKNKKNEGDLTVSFTID